MRTFKVLLADDHALVRQGTRRILEDYPDLMVVGEASDGQQAVELAKRLNPDVAVLDIRMPRLSGVDVVRAVSRISPTTKILVLSAYDDDEYVLAMMGAGISGYLLKTAGSGELVKAVRSVALGKNVLHPDIALKIARLWAHRRAVGERDAHGQLSPREIDVLRLAAKGMHTKAIADQLGIGIRTVNGHFNSIFNKLGVSSRIQAVLYVISRHLVSANEGTSDAV